MNIFATSDSPIDCAIVLDDIRLNKMIVESGQMLSSALYKNNICDIFYKPAYLKHPCTIWASTTKQNFQWLLDHGLAMCVTFEMITGKVHKTERVLWNMRDYSLFMPSSHRTEFEDCTYFKGRIDIDVHEKYKLHLNHKWQQDADPKWSKRKIPDFFVPKVIT